MISFKGYALALFGILIVVVVFLPGAYAPDYQKFITQHYDNPKSSVGKNYCNTMMQRRGMTRPECKEVNTFIHGSKKKIIAVCGKGGEPYGAGLRRSKSKFSVTTCKHTGGSKRPPCKYRENSSQRFIIVRCAGGKPVHYDEGHI
ncbi:ribonuclease-like [Elgaria multicarinata webbii]|uniref:ribonuclease-like n=1 Tax=Elgaria multicarinata webbii TaxID=159646 RepID=UPI002FCD1CA9